jgi:HK97 family phage portal protein
MPTTDYEKVFGNSIAGSAAGIDVNSFSALKLSAVFSCVRILSEQPASFPISVTRRANNKREDLSDGAIYKLLQFPNKFMHRYSFIELMNARLQLHGNSYAVIKFDSFGNPTDLIPVDSSCVIVTLYNGEPFYDIHDPDMGINGTFFHWEVIHFKILSRNGVTGISPITAAREGIGLGLAAERFGADFFQKGGNLKGVLETDNHIDDGVFKKWKKRWEEFYGGAVGDHTTPILEYGLKYKQLGIPPNDAQFIETRVFQLQDVARFFNMPPSIIGDLSRATFSNGEQQDLQLVKYNLRPTLSGQESELERKLVSKKDRGLIQIRYNMADLLRADSKTRAEVEQIQVSTGIITRNEARDMEDRAPLPGLDEPLDPKFLTGSKTQVQPPDNNNPPK